MQTNGELMQEEQLLRISLILQSNSEIALIKQKWEQIKVIFLVDNNINIIEKMIKISRETQNILSENDLTKLSTHLMLLNELKNSLTRMEGRFVQESCLQTLNDIKPNQDEIKRRFFKNLKEEIENKQNKIRCDIEKEEKQELNLLLQKLFLEIENIKKENEKKVNKTLELTNEESNSRQNVENEEQQKRDFLWQKFFEDEEYKRRQMKKREEAMKMAIQFFEKEEGESRKSVVELERRSRNFIQEIREIKRKFLIMDIVAKVVAQETECRTAVERAEEQELKRIEFFIAEKKIIDLEMRQRQICYSIFQAELMFAARFAGLRRQEMERVAFANFRTREENITRIILEMHRQLGLEIIFNEIVV